MPAKPDKQELKPLNMITEIDKELEEIENTELTKKKKQLTFLTPSHSSNNSKKFSVYEDVNESSPESKVRPMKITMKTPTSRKKEPKSSTSVPVTPSRRVTRSKMI